ncbi:MAG: hypothetical protein ACREYC_18705 [Gammaproteobacteria bacterium]
MLSRTFIGFTRKEPEKGFKREGLDVHAGFTPEARLRWIPTTYSTVDWQRPYVSAAQYRRLLRHSHPAARGSVPSFGMRIAGPMKKFVVVCDIDPHVITRPRLT